MENDQLEKKVTLTNNNVYFNFQVDHYRCRASSSLSEQHMHYMLELENVAEALQILHLFQLVNNA